MLAIQSKRKPNVSRSFLFRLSVVLIFSSLITSCQPPKPAAQEPTLEVATTGKEVGPWKVIAAEETRFVATAPGAREVKIIYRPAESIRRYAELGKLTSTDKDGKFVLTWKPNADFTGEVWAEAIWEDGTQRKSNVLALASDEAISLGGEIPLDNIGSTAGTNVSARSDQFTGGKIIKASLAPGDSHIWITVDVPAFRLTLWQRGKEITTYQIGVGRLDFQLPVGERKATEIVWNPEWVPPDSKWVTTAEPGEKIEADDPRNPLGKIKIRLGNAILIHEAASSADIGRLASHGCVRMLPEDLFDLAEKIVTARKLPVTKEQIEATKTNTERLAVKLDPPLWVDVNYDTQVVEGGVLHLYPDVYKRNRNRLGDLQQTLSKNGVAQMDDTALQQLLGRVTRKEEFMVNLADLKAGRALEVGKQVPLVDIQAPEA